MCGQGLSGSPLVQRILRSPLCFPSVKNVPTMKSRILSPSPFQFVIEWPICRKEHGCSGRTVVLTEGEGNNVKQSRLAMSIH